MRRQSFSTKQESVANALDISRDNQNVVIAGRSVFKVFRIEEQAFTERMNLRPSKNLNLNYSCSDVVWSPHKDSLIATAATNGAVVLWNLAKQNKTKMEHVFTGQRAVNKVNFNPGDPSLLVSASQDALLKLFDLRSFDCVCSFAQNVEAIRDVQFSPHNNVQLASVAENGRVNLWDLRRTDRPEKSWTAHSEYIFSIDWHPEIRGWLATAGRDKTIKIWKTAENRPSMDVSIQTIAPVGKVRWRPGRRSHIASSSMALDFTINVWDIRRPYVPFAMFDCHKEVSTGIVWRGDPHTLLSTSKDGSLYQHSFDKASRPAVNANPVGLCISAAGALSHVFRDYSNRGRGPTQGYSNIDMQPSSSSPGIIPHPPPMPSKDIPGSSRLKKEAKSANELFMISKSILEVFPMEENDVIALTSNEHVVYLAKNYLLGGLSFSELCDHNANIANRARQRQTSISWTTIKTLCGGFNYVFASSIANMQMDERCLADRGITAVSTGVVDAVKTTATAPPVDSKRTKLRHYSSKLRTISGESSNSQQAHRRKISVGMATPGAAANMTPLDKIDQASESEEDSVDNNDMTLTNIASGQMLGGASSSATGPPDVFGDCDLLRDLNLEQAVETDAAQSAYEWDAKTTKNFHTEAFDVRHDITRSMNHDDADVLAAGGSPTHLESLSAREATGQSQSTQLTEKENDFLISVDTIPSYPSWSPDKSLQDLLVHLVDNGDVQTAVIMYIVIGHDKLKHLFDEVTLEHWFNAYIELLQQFQLYNEVTQLIQKCPLRSVRERQLDMTTYYSNCTACSKALKLRSGAWYCTRCKTLPNLCAICHNVVKGMFIWCQGCGHGGHYGHLKTWYAMKKQCPAGCGHFCEYQ